MNIEPKIINIPFMGYKTHCLVYGNVKASTPIIVLHGGPGGSVERYEALNQLALYDVPLIFYDQLGCGYSKVPQGHKELWTFKTYEDELENVIKYFNLNSYIILGHSWGGMLALEWVTSRSHAGLKKLILFSTLPSTKIWNDEHLKMIKNFPSEYIDVLAKQRQGEEYDHKLYKRAIKKFYDEHVGKKEHKKYIYVRKRFPKTNKEIYEYMWGKSELFGTGTLLNYNVESKLHNIDVPTLILSGAYDESTPHMNELMHKKIANSEWILLENSHHIGYAEETEKVIDTIRRFIDE